MMKPMVLDQGHARLPQGEISDSEDEPVTRGSLYNFAVLNSLVTGHLGKKIIHTNW